MDISELKHRQNLSLEDKIQMSLRRIRDWYEFWEGQVYVSFSGGKDSTVLLHLVRSIYPEVPAVFVNTGLEYPEILKFVKTIDNVMTLRPKMKFKDVIDKYGYPVVSKRNARFISDIQNRSDKNKATVNIRLTGYNKAMKYCPSGILPKKWRDLAFSDIKVSHRCCDILKKEPFRRYQKLYKKMPITGVMAHESKMRTEQYLRNGCNAFASKTNPISMPLSFWLEKDIYEYIKNNNIQIAKIYQTEKRTGCMFCMFGVHLEKGTNRFQRMKITHPKHYDYCINKLGCGKVLDFINVPY